MPLRQPCVPAHDAGAQGLSRPSAAPALKPVPEPPRLAWDAAALQDRLSPLWPGLVVQVVAHCPSTNSELLERARLQGEALAPTLLVAEAQSAGRGRMGRIWHAQAGASLTFSLALDLAAADWSGLSLAVGLALAEALDPQPAGTDAAPQLGLKWPNDVWLCDAPNLGVNHGMNPGRKLAGILIETRQAGARRVAVIGIGLNILPQPQDGPSAGSACWQELLSRQGLEPRPAGEQVSEQVSERASAPAALARVAAALLPALRRFQAQGFAPLVPAFAARDVLRGQWVRSSTAVEPPQVPPQIQLQGRAEGVDAQGALCVRVAGQLQRLVSGEISVRLITPVAAPTTAPF